MYGLTIGMFFKHRCWEGLWHCYKGLKNIWHKIKAFTKLTVLQETAAFFHDTFHEKVGILIYDKLERSCRIEEEKSTWALREHSTPLLPPRCGNSVGITNKMATTCAPHGPLRMRGFTRKEGMGRDITKGT
uniref:Uncharacterized protein n=1 Tax=Amphimedon queenslandica TaxID=400682 RepID=A0A1X7V1H0_AMPQE